MVGRVERERTDVVWFDTVSNKAACGMGVEADHEEECLRVGLGVIKLDVGMTFTRWCVYQNDSKHLSLIFLCAVVYMRSMRRSMLFAGQRQGTSRAQRSTYT